MFYEVLAKCGHVGRNHYVLKEFFIRADSAVDAAKRIRCAPRVKHHHKDAIRYVKEIDYDEYVDGVKKMKEDYYFNIHNSSDQKRMFNEIIYREKFVEIEENRNLIYKLKKIKIQ